MTRHEEKTRAIGLMTIKALIDKQRYKIVEVVDADTEKSYDMIQARRKGLIDLKTNEYVYSQTKDRISLDEAIDKELVIVEFEQTVEDNNNERMDEIESRTYAVNYVVDLMKKTKVPFYQAMKRGLIDPETGSYLNNVTGEKIHLVDAIKKGFLKGSNIKDSKGLNIDAKNEVVIEAMGKIKKNVLNPLSVIVAFRRAAKVSCLRSANGPLRNIIASYI